jgi:crossover junction endodeoxyribonuclease RusA
MSKTIYDVFISGIPKAQPRPRMAAGGHVYNPPSADAWKEQVKTGFMSCRKPIITKPVRLKVIFFMPVPKKIKPKGAKLVPCGKKPDTDNLLKAVMDAMTDAGVWEDDALVYQAEASKFYDWGNGTGAQILVLEEGK